MIEKVFEDVLEEELGASFVAWQDGEEKISLHGGWRDRHQSEPWTATTMAPVWSATKGPMAAALYLALQKAGMDAQSEVRRVWPELRAGRDLTFGELFSHQGGLAALDEKVSIWDYEAVIAALERQVPKWTVGAHGYHPRTIGFLADELVRRLTGATLGDFFRREIAAPGGMDVWIGLPKAEQGRVAELVPARAGSSGKPEEFYQALLRKESLTRQAFSSPAEFTGVSEMNQPRAWEAGWPGMGGVASAVGLAKFYHWLGQQSFFPEMAARQAEGMDLIQQVPSAFGFGLKFAEDGWVGHPGAGGSYGRHHPESGWSCAFVMNRFEANLFPSEKRLSLVRALSGRLLGASLTGNEMSSP